MARKSKYSLAIQEKICQALIEGNTIKSICESVNIDKATFYRWLENNATFATAIKRAETKRDLNGELLAVHHIFNKMEDHWQAAAWWLERRFPEKYKNVQQIQDTTNYNELREKLVKLLQKNEPNRATNS